MRVRLGRRGGGEIKIEGGRKGESGEEGARKEPG